MRKAKPPRGLRGTRLELGGHAYVVLSYPAPTPHQPRLTAAEREVVELALEGWTSAAIAAARSTARRTVDKQLESSYRKLGVSSRAELAARFAPERRAIARD